MNLQSGTVYALYNSQKNNPLHKSPVLQIISFSKLIMGENVKHRYKANVSDGQHYMKAVFSSELCSVFDDGKIQKNHLIRLSTFTIRPKENNNYLYIQSLSGEQAAPDMLGSPVNIITGRAPMENSNNSEAPTPMAKPQVCASPTVAIKRSVENASNRNESKKMKESHNEAFIEIKDLNPFQSNWVIKGRVVSKSEIKKFTTAKGEGKLFSFEIADESAQVKCVSFSETADIFFPLIEVGKVFTVAHGTIKIANKKFAVNNMAYEIQLERNTEVQQIEEDDETPRYFFNFVPIKELALGATFVDIIAVIKEVFPASTIVTKSTNKELFKRDLIIVDKTGNCRLTLWGARAEEEYGEGRIICLKAAKVGEYNGVNLSTVSSTQVLLDCDVPEAVSLMSWYENEGRSIVIERPKRVPRVHLISEVKDDNIEYSTILGTILFIKEESLFYESCPSENCNKKVTMEDNGSYRCERCNYTYPNCNYRYMLSMHVGDFTGQIWLTAFDEAGKKLFGFSAEQLKEMANENPQDMLNLVKDLAFMEFQINMKAKDDEYNGELKKRFTCLDIMPLNYEQETHKMLEAIEKVKF